MMRTRWSPAWGHVQVPFDDVLVPATRAVSMERLGRLDPVGADPVRAYEPGYLAGFKAQRYQVELPQGYEQAKEIMRGSILEACCRDIGGGRRRVSDLKRGNTTKLRSNTSCCRCGLGRTGFKGKCFRFW